MERTEAHVEVRHYREGSNLRHFTERTDGSRVVQHVTGPNCSCVPALIPHKPVVHTGSLDD